METTTTIVTALDQDQLGSASNDVQTLNAGNDKMFGGAGSDTMDGGAGSDFLNGGSGADTLYYTLAQNTGATDTYMGGSGKDTLVIRLTAAEWTLYQARIMEHVTHLKAVTNTVTGEVSNGLASDFIYRFGSATLTVQMMEKLQVYVDGIKFLDSTDKTPTSTNATAVVIEDTAKILGVGDFGTFSDGDAGDSLKAVQITTLPLNGVLKLDGVAVTAGQVISVGDINANRLVYTPAANDDTNEQLSFKVMDQADVVSVAYTLTLAITPVNDASVVSAGGTLAYTENQAPTAINTGLTITDIDSAQLAGAVVSITSNFQAGQDVLGFTNQNGITGSYNAATGVLTLTGTSSLANYQAALRSVTYSNSSESPDTAARTVSFRVDDGGSANNLSNVATSSITVAAVNDAPTSANDSVTFNEDTARTLTVGDFGTFSDPDTGDSLKAVKITVLPLNGNLTLDGAAVTAGQSILVADITANKLVYTPAANDDTDEALSFKVVDQANAESVTYTLTLDITPANDAPNIQVAGTDSAAKTLAETNAGLTSTGTLSVTDVDPLDTVASSVTGVVLSGTTGSLTAAGVQGYLTVSPSTGLAADPGASQNLSWNFNSGTEAFNYLAPGQSLTLAYTIQSSDGNGGSDTQQVSITITGTADGPTDIVLTGVAPGGVIGGNNVPSGTIGQFSATGGFGSISFSTTLVEKSLAGVAQSDATPDVTVSASGLVTAVGGATGLEAGRIYELNVTASDGGGSLTELFRVITGTTGSDSISLSSPVDDLALLIGDNDTVFAGAGDDTIYGQNGNDLIHGGEGNDTLYGMNGDNTFFFDTALNAATNVDSIFGFNAGSSDLLSLSSSQFAGISASGGVLSAADYQQVNTGGTGDVTGLSVGSAVNVIFDSSTGKLFYDANGGTLGDAVQFAVLIGVTGTFDNNDIIVGS